MPKSISLIPKAPTARILLNNGADRVSKEAMFFFGQVLEDYALEISKKAVMIAKHSGRKTIKGKDLRLAMQ
ncbi:MAG: histone family protein [Candidatus Woesearchaeota archaeon]